MKKTKEELWQRFQKHYTEFPEIDLAIDLSRIDFPENFFKSMESAIQKAFREMAELESGAIANPDEGRMVGHYWLRHPGLAPTDEIRQEIEENVKKIQEFATEVHQGKIRGQGGSFKNLLLIGIGGSALGPQFVSNALSNPTTDKLKIYFFDNTDPDGMDRVLSTIGDQLDRTLCVVVSKSGKTKETRNGMLEAEVAYSAKGLNFGAHCVAVTGCGGDLDKHAKSHGWLKIFPMWDWVGGRTSETSSVGLLPAALQGFDVDELLKGARTCDEVTRVAELRLNPAAQIALAWHSVGNGKGVKDMVVLPYKDRLELFSRYLQQLLMESLGKERDIDNHIVNQGIAVYGNKGSTDQHAYVQQLRDGVNNFFVVFIQVLRERAARPQFVDLGVTSGDYLNGFLLGTREALYENGRQSITITTTEVSAYSVGVLIALFERAVGLYASLIHINAYHQPGVEAGKRAAEAVLDVQRQILLLLDKHCGSYKSIAEIGEEIGGNKLEEVFKICQHLAANEYRGIQRQQGSGPLDVSFRKRK